MSQLGPILILLVQNDDGVLDCNLIHDGLDCLEKLSGINFEKIKIQFNYNRIIHKM